MRSSTSFPRQRDGMKLTGGVFAWTGSQRRPNLGWSYSHDGRKAWREDLPRLESEQVMTIGRRPRPVGQVAALAATALLALLGQKLIDIWVQDAGGNLAFLRGWPGAVLVIVVCAAIAYLWLRRERHATDLESLVARMGIDVRYYPMPTDDRGRALDLKFGEVSAWDAARRAIENVTPSGRVIVVRYLREGRALDEQASSARRRYLESLERLMRQANVYQIVQIPPEMGKHVDTSGLADTMEPTLYAISVVP
jgi:hypothetical protein